MRLALAAFFATALLAVPSLSGAAPPPLVSVSAYPTTAAGSVVRCPVTLNFQGAISVSNWPASPPGRIFQYTWIANKGAAGPPHVLRNQPNAFIVSPTYTATLGVNGTYWLALQATAPRPTNINVTSNHITFTLTCPIIVPKTGRVIPGSLAFPPTQAPITPGVTAPYARPSFFNPPRPVPTK